MTETQLLILRGWQAIAAHYQRDPTTIRQWVKDKKTNATKNGCPISQVGRAYEIEVNAFNVWLDKNVAGWRKHNSEKNIEC